MSVEFDREQTNTSGQRAEFFEDFKAMPLDEKFSNLFKLEIEMLNDLVKTGAECAFSVLESVGEAISKFGTKVEAEAKAASDASSEEKSSEIPYEPAGEHPPQEWRSEPEAPSYPTDGGYDPPNRSDNNFD